MVIGHSSSMGLTDKIFLQTHVTFCECVCSMNFDVICILLLLNTLNKKASQINFFSVAEIMLETLGLQDDEKLGHTSALGQLIRSAVDSFT